MDYEKLAVAIKLCGSTPKVDQCPQCPYWASGDMNNCIPRVTADAATAITDLLARAEAAEKKATELDKALFDAAKVVRTMQERTIPYYRNRTEAAEKEVEWKNKVIEAAERRFVEAEARAEKAERERDAAISDLTYIARTYPVDLCDNLVCQYCKHYQNVNTGCPGWIENDCFEWRGKKEE